MHTKNQPGTNLLDNFLFTPLFFQIHKWFAKLGRIKKNKLESKKSDVLSLFTSNDEVLQTTQTRTSAKRKRPRIIENLKSTQIHKSSHKEETFDLFQKTDIKSYVWKDIPVVAQNFKGTSIHTNRIISSQMYIIKKYCGLIYFDYYKGAD